MKISNYLKFNPLSYWIDYIISSSIFIVCFYFVYNSGSIIAFVLGSIFLYRAGAFIHELAHQKDNPKLAIFKKVWNYTMGFLMMQPSLRFQVPHFIHHTTGIFSTKEDPQYPLIFSDWKLAAKIFLVLPWFLPIYNFLICLYKKPNNSLETILYKDIKFSEEQYKEINNYEVKYLFLFVAVCIVNIKLIPVYYLMSVAAWYLSVCRIPLEHKLVSYKETSDFEDQRLDSFTHEHPLYIIVQPLALRYHTAHHMYPRVPYTQLAKLTKDLRSNGITIN